MNDSNFLKEVKLFPLAKKNFKFDNIIPSSEFKLLSDSIDNDVEDIKLEFSLFLLNEKTPVIKAEAIAVVNVDCQRCLESFDLTIKINFLYAFVKNKQKANVESKLETIVYEDKVNVIDIIDEELLLALPMITKHKNCQMNYKNKNLKEISELKEIESKINPFAILKKLKK